MVSCEAAAQGHWFPYRVWGWNPLELAQCLVMGGWAWREGRGRMGGQRSSADHESAQKPKDKKLGQICGVSWSHRELASDSFYLQPLTCLRKQSVCWDRVYSLPRCPGAIVFIHGGSLNCIPAIHFYRHKSQSPIRDLIILKTSKQKIPQEKRHFIRAKHFINLNHQVLIKLWQPLWAWALVLNNFH